MSWKPQKKENKSNWKYGKNVRFSTIFISSRIQQQQNRIIYVRGRLAREQWLSIYFTWIAHIKVGAAASASAQNAPIFSILSSNLLSRMTDE